MDATVDDFLKEINALVPPKDKKQEDTRNAWKECIDKQTGYPYYWNIHTDEVTWDAPEGFQKSSESVKASKHNNLFLPPKTTPILPKVEVPVESVKIYKIGGNDKEKTQNSVSRIVQKAKSLNNKPKRKSSDSEDEKIMLISSYGSDSESEEEEDAIQSETNTENSKPSHVTTNDKKANSNHTVANTVKTETTTIRRIELVKEKQEIKKEVSGFTLVAGYGSEDDEEDEQEDSKDNTVTTTLFPIKNGPLFPVTETSDTNPNTEKKTLFNIDDDIDRKVFQRKRKIGIELINSKKRPEASDLNERSGLGFKQKNVEYPGFKSGGVLFVKSDASSPTQPSANVENVAELKAVEFSTTISKKAEESRVMLGEKLGFLSEGHQQASAVQVMLIQMDTLHSALLDGCLKASYFEKWLNDTCSELINLEHDATPAGWLLQWDRSNKRYYYRNKLTGESQWEYPQPDIIRCDEAMDISTTPPPPPDEARDEADHVPPPPRISSPKPPPPPIISESGRKSKMLDPPLPPTLSVASPLPPLPPDDRSKEPLPPGVDSPETSSYGPENENANVPKDQLNSALDSFYSDLAAISNENSNPGSVVQTPQEPEDVAPVAIKQVKKKKKTKIAQGLAMKKKGVSKLVEKWKNVQKSMD